VGVTPRTFTEMGVFGNSFGSKPEGERAGGQVLGSDASVSSESALPLRGSAVHRQQSESHAGSVSSLRTGTAFGSEAPGAATRRSTRDSASVSSLKASATPAVRAKVSNRRAAEAASSVSSLRTDALRPESNEIARPTFYPSASTPPRGLPNNPAGDLTDLVLSSADTSVVTAATSLTGAPSNLQIKQNLPRMPMRQLTSANVPSYVQLPAKQCPVPSSEGSGSSDSPSNRTKEPGHKPGIHNLARDDDDSDEAENPQDRSAVPTEGPGVSPISLDYRDYLEGGPEAVDVAWSARTTELMMNEGAGAGETQSLIGEMRQRLPTIPEGATAEAAALEKKLKRQWAEIERMHRITVGMERDFIQTVRAFCDKCAEGQQSQRLERKSAKYVRELGRSEPTDLPSSSVSVAALWSSIENLEQRSGLLHGEPRRLVSSLAADLAELAEPLRDKECEKWVGNEHVRLGLMQRPVDLLEDLNHILTVTSTMRVSDIKVELPDAARTCCSPTRAPLRQQDEEQRLFLDACQAVKHGLEGKLSIIEETRARISSDLVASSPLLEGMQAELSALLRSVEKRSRGRGGGERELSSSLETFEEVQAEKAKLLDEKGALLNQQAEDIDQVLDLKRKSLYNDLLDRVKVEAEQSKRKQERTLLELVTNKVISAVSAQLHVVRARSDAVAAARKIAKRQSEFLSTAQKFIVSQIGTAMERIHRLAVGAHEHCLEVAQQEWNGLEMFYGRWDSIASQSRDAAELGVAHAAMDKLKEDFRRLPAWVWNQQSFQQLSEEDPARFAEVRSALGRALEGSAVGSSYTKESLEGLEADVAAQEVWLAHLGALARDGQTPRTVF